MRNSIATGRLARVQTRVYHGVAQPAWRRCAFCLGAALSVAALACDSAGTAPQVQAPRKSATAEAAAVQLDDTPAARQLAAWLAAFNSHDASALRQYQDKNLANGRASSDLLFVEHEVDQRSAAAGFVVRTIESSSPTRLVAILRERSTELSVRAIVEVDAPSPHRVTWLQMNPVPIRDQLGPARMSESRRHRRLARRAHRFERERQVFGCHRRCQERDADFQRGMWARRP